MHKELTVPVVSIVVVLGVALMLGFMIGIGVASTAGPETTTTTKPGTVTETREAATVPRPCLDALGYADTGFGYAADFAAYASDGFDAAARFDVDEMNEARAGIDEVTEKINGISADWNVAKEECRAAAH